MAEREAVFSERIAELRSAIKFLTTAPPEVRSHLSDVDPRRQLLSWALATSGRAWQGCELAARVLVDVDQIIAPFAGPLEELGNTVSVLHREAEETQAWLDMRNEEHPTWVPNLDGWIGELWEGAASALDRTIRTLEQARLAPAVEAFSINSLLPVPIFEVEPRRLEALSPEEFELLVAERLEAMGLEPIRVGHSNSPDGGIDIIAVPRRTVVPFILAVQVKHHAGKKKTGSPDVQRFIGAMTTNPFDVGMLVTNTSFVPEARVLAERAAKRIMLRDRDDLRHWIKGEFLRDVEWREVPKVIELGKHRITIPRS